MKLSDIIITENFKLTTPLAHKMDKCREYYATHGKLDRDILVNRSNQLIDGYIGYLVLKENDVEEVDVVVRTKKYNLTHPSKYDNYRTKETVYVFGKHTEDSIERVWRLSNNEITVDDLHIGQQAYVATKRGPMIITITKIQILDRPPVETKVRRVIGLI